MTTARLFESEDVFDRAKAACARGDRSDAEALFKRAIDERAKALGAEDGSVGDYTYALGHHYLMHKSYGAALEQLNKAVSILEKAYYGGHAKLAPALDDIADAYTAQNKFTEAEPVLVRLLDIVDKTMNGDHRYNFTTMHKLAYVYRELNKLPDAEKILLKALKTIDTPLGPAEEFKLDLALLYMQQDKNAEAETNFKAAIYGFEQRKNYARLAEALDAYAGLLRKLNRSDEAAKTTSLAEQVRKTHKAHEHPNDIFPATLLRA